MVASEVFAEVRADVDDPEGDYASDAYILPHLNRAQYKLVEQLLENPNVSRFKTLAILPAVPAGTVSLKDYFQPKGALALLDEILDFREKPAGQSDLQYAPLVEKLIPVATPQLNFNGTYTFTGGDIILPGATQALDLRIWGYFKPQPVTDGTSPILPGCGTAIISLTSARVARAHGNVQLGKDLYNDYMESLDAITNRLIQQQQLEPSRPEGYSHNGLSNLNIFEF